jgi:signal transduction histidine kinase
MRSSVPGAAEPPTLGGLPLPRLQRSDEGRVVAGVCSGIGQELRVDPTLVRLAFAVLSLASGSGIVAYLGAWALLPDPGRETSRRQRVAGALLLVLSAFLAMRGLGLADSLLWPSALVAIGVAFLWRIPAGQRLSRPMTGAAALGFLLIVAGAASFVSAGLPFEGGAPLAPGALAIGLIVVIGPWLWRLVRERDAERLARIRSDERAEVAARVHDSVLQTLALIQRHADDPRQVATLARHEERELRGWLYRDRSEGSTLLAAIELAAAEVEQLHRVRVEVVGSGDCPLDEQLDALVLAAREAMTNAAKFSGAEAVSVYAEAGDGGVSVFVRDTGKGFDRASVPTDRRGIAESIEGRMRRHSGSATVTSAPGAGTEVELTLTRAGQ